jgi:hypothetical protein
VTNRKVIGKMKDEYPNDPIDEFVGLRAKLYSLKTKSEESKRAKGIAKCVVRNTLRHSDYLGTLFSRSQMFVGIQSLRSHKHIVYAEQSSKLALTPFDDKRYILSDGIHTLPFGYVHD